MERIDLLDLNHDILNVLGDFVTKIMKVGPNLYFCSKRH